MKTITAVDLARRAGIDPQKLRKALRKHKGDSDLAWHHWNDPWIAEMESDRHRAMEHILDEVLKARNSRRKGTMTIKYGLAEYDRHTGRFDWNINLPMDEVKSGNIYEFFRSAGENGWELCGAFPCGVKGINRAIGTKGEVKTCEDPTEQIAFIFKHVD